MADDAASLIARLEARIDKFEKSMRDASAITDKTMKGIEDRFAETNKVVSKRLQDLSYSASTQLGTIGAVMRTLGPAGVVAAVGLGSVVLAFDAAAKGAQELAEKAKGIRDLGATTGLTNTEVQALRSEASKVGVTSEEVGQFVTKLTVNLDELRRGGGTLREELLRINPALVDQLEVTKSTAAAITILGRAYGDLDKFQANALSKAIGGHAGISAAGRLLPGLDLVGLAQQFEAAGRGLDDNLIKKLPQLALEAEKASKKAKENFASIFAEDVLTAQKQSAEAMLRFSERAKNFTMSEDLKRLISKGSDWVPGWWNDLLAVLPVMKQVATGTLPADDRPTGAPAGSAASRIGATFSGPMLLPPTETAPKRSAGAELATFREFTAVLGNAITPAEQLKLKQLELNAAIEANPRVAGAAARGLDAFKLAQMQVAVAIKEQLGVVTQQEIVEARIAALRDLQAKGMITNAAVIAQAEQVIQKEARATAEAIQVRASALPQTTQYLLDARNGAKQLDTALASGLTSAENAFADAVTGAKDLKSAIADLAASAARDFAKMAFRSAIGGLFGGGGGLLSGLFGGGGSNSAAAGAAASSAGGGLAAAFGGSFAGGGEPPAGRVSLVGERGPELFIPKAAGTIVPNDVVRGLGGGETHVTVTGPTINIQGDASEKTVALIRQAFEQYDRGTVSRVAKAVVEARLRSNRGV